MKSFSRRDVLKSSLLAPAIAVAAHDLSPMAAAMEVAALDPDPQSQSAPSQSTYPSAGRERLLLDFGWRFHFGHADDPAKDFGFGSGRSGNFQKTGNFLPAGSIAFDDSDWTAVDLPHDWAIELPFKNDPALASKGFYPLGRNYPGHQRRLVSPRLRTARGRRGQAHHDRVRRRLSRDHGGLQRLLHRPPQRRIRSVPLRRDRLRQSRRKQCAAGARRCHLERRLVLRRRRHLSARLAGEDEPGSCEEVGHVRARRRSRPARPPSRSARN